MNEYSLAYLTTPACSHSAATSGVDVMGAVMTATVAAIVVPGTVSSAGDVSHGVDGRPAGIGIRVGLGLGLEVRGAWVALGCVGTDVGDGVGCSVGVRSGVDGRGGVDSCNGLCVGKRVGESVGGDVGDGAKVGDATGGLVVMVMVLPPPQLQHITDAVNL